MNEKFLNLHFIGPDIPMWPCPSCAHGVLLVYDNKFDNHLDAASKKEGGEYWFDPDMNKFVFSSTMECNVCKETVIVSGIGGVEEDWGEDAYVQRQWYEYYTPTYFQPALRIIEVPQNDKISAKLLDLLGKSFSLFWCDYDACANRIRATLEVLLDDMGIPRRMKLDAKRDMSLHDRIELIEAAAGSELDDVKQMIMAVKWLGNAGTHELDGIDRAELIDGYKMLELSLHRLYPSINPDSAKLVARARAINLAMRPPKQQ